VRKGPNVYTYVVQNPWTKFDPLGLEAKDEGDVDRDKHEPLPKRETQEESRKPHPQSQAEKPFDSAREAAEASAAELSDLTDADKNTSEWGTRYYKRQKVDAKGNLVSDANGKPAYEYTYATPVRGVDQNGDPYNVDPSKSAIEGGGWKAAEAFNHSHPGNNRNEDLNDATHFSNIDISWTHNRAIDKNNPVTLFVTTPDRSLESFTAAPAPDLQYQQTQLPAVTQFNNGTFKKHQ
jgi:hypothetical protein